MDSDRLAAVFVELADTLVDDFDVLDQLQVLAARAVELLGAEAAGLLLTDDGGDLRLVVASNEQAELMELFQLQGDEGPCLDCYHTGQPVLVPRLDWRRNGGRTSPPPLPRQASAASSRCRCGCAVR